MSKKPNWRTNGHFKSVAILQNVKFSVYPNFAKACKQNIFGLVVRDRSDDPEKQRRPAGSAPSLPKPDDEPAMVQQQGDALGAPLEERRKRRRRASLTRSVLCAITSKGELEPSCSGNINGDSAALFSLQ